MPDQTGENKDKTQAVDNTTEEKILEQGEAKPEALDIENLDLSIETVEDRISPSETNVFDK